MPDVIAVLWVSLEHAELGPVAIAYETGQGDLGAGVATRDGAGGPLGGDGLRTAHCAALRGYRRFAGAEIFCALRLAAPRSQLLIEGKRAFGGSRRAPSSSMARAWCANRASFRNTFER